MSEVKSNALKIAGALCLSVLIGYQTLSNSFDKKSAISDLKAMNLEEVALKESISGRSIRSTRDEAILNEIEICLSEVTKIPNYRFGEDVNWEVVSFIGDKNVHNISYAKLSSGKIALGVEYILTNTETGESTNLGGGRGISSECLGGLFNKI